MIKKTIILSRVAFFISTGIILSEIRLFRLPSGGSITPCSMFFLFLPGYLYGPQIGILSAIIAGLIGFIINPIFLNPIQFFLDYILAFGLLGSSKIFLKNKTIIINYLLASALKLLCSVISGILFFNSYGPKVLLSYLYSLAYNSSYHIPEIILTVMLYNLGLKKFLK
ncbi:MAG: energy-coupled thiamine transporter ThiT [Clostridiales bacterium]|jgi:thiamine transporter|nr:energy-coupled thiamine transporter ThiT [Clostridiales bacterium]